MKCFEWNIEESEQLGAVLRPVAEIAIKDTNGNWKYISTYVDSGADISVFQRSFGELLGFDIERGEYAKFGGAGGGEVEVYIHKVTLKLGEDVLAAKVAFCKKHESKTPNVLGRLDLFDMFEIHFRNLDKETCFVLTKTNKGALNPKERI